MPRKDLSRLSTTEMMAVCHARISLACRPRSVTERTSPTVWDQPSLSDRLSEMPPTVTPPLNGGEEGLLRGERRRGRDDDGAAAAAALVSSPPRRRRGALAAQRAVDEVHQG